MRHLDRERRLAGLAWVAAGTAFGAWSGGHRDVTPGPLTAGLAGIVIGLAVLHVARAPARVLAVAARLTGVVLGLDFAAAVADRCGLLGAPGSPGVSWGSWAAFVDYTQVLLPSAPRTIAVAAAVAATVLELALAALLVGGVQPRWVGKATAGLLVVYLVAMASAVGADEVATYAVPVLVGGALLVSATTEPAARQLSDDPANRAPRVAR